MPVFTVHRDGNRLTLKGGREQIFYEVSDGLPEHDDHSFAVWHLLPVALKEGFDIRIDGPVDPLVVENAERVARTWELWRPDALGPVRVSATSNPAAPPEGRGPVVFYSGGIDSTHMLLERGRSSSPVDAVTVQGMDYGANADDQFARYVASTTPFLESMNYRRSFIRSNAAKIVKGDHAWGLALAGYGFLLTGRHDRGIFASDYDWAQDMTAFPWGLNHVTNRMMLGSSFAMEPQSENSTRAQKVGVIAEDPAALASTSFCKVRAIRPRNCGMCSKCLRTKAMFAGMTGAIPPIFDEPRLSSSDLKKIDIRDRNERAFLIDLHQRAQMSGHLDALPGIEDVVSRLYRRRRLRRFLSRKRSFVG